MAIKIEEKLNLDWLLVDHYRFHYLLLMTETARKDYKQTKSDAAKEIIINQVKACIEKSNLRMNKQLACLLFEIGDK